jgi:hypothetical protein
MRVVAKALGYYQHRRYREGSEFTIAKPEDLRSWMEPLDNDGGPEPERPQRKERKGRAG